jgi:hypothetical protein
MAEKQSDESDTPPHTGCDVHLHIDRYIELDFGVHKDLAVKPEPARACNFPKYLFRAPCMALSPRCARQRFDVPRTGGSFLRTTLLASTAPLCRSLYVRQRSRESSLPPTGVSPRAGVAMSGRSVNIYLQYACFQVRITFSYVNSVHIGRGAGGTHPGENQGRGPKGRVLCQLG